jgi:hypothetical protein
VRRNGSVRNAQKDMLFNLIGKPILRLAVLENTDVTVALFSQGNYLILSPLLII